MSSRCLVKGASPALSGFEFGLILVTCAFHRWMIRATAAESVQELSPPDGLVPHAVNHRGHKKKLADICLVRNIEDTRVVDYALKKLERLKLIERERIGKEKAVAITPTGEAVCLKYREIREALLVKAVRATGFHEATISNLAATMRALSGQYDQAARAAASV